MTSVLLIGGAALLVLAVMPDTGDDGRKAGNIDAAKKHNEEGFHFLRNI